MAKTFKVLTIPGSPHHRKSDTRALVEDFVDEVAGAWLARRALLRGPVSPSVADTL